MSATGFTFQTTAHIFPARPPEKPMREAVVLMLIFLAAGPAHAACNGDLLSVKEWSIKPIDADTNELTVTLASGSDKPIRMIDGQFGFRDALGGHVASAAIDRDAAIPAGGDYTQTGTWGPYTFERLLKLKSEEVEAFACVKSVLYEDGTKEVF
jgi:hypothetical protein